jgi:SAM-dependent methyltransferase
MGRSDGYAMCDWIDNAIALQMSRTEGQIYGYIHLPCRVEVNARLRAWRPSVEKALAEFTGERVIPGQVDVDLLNEHMARYTFAARLARGKRVLDAGCGAGYGSAELASQADSVTVGVDVAPKPSISPALTTACPTSPSSRLPAKAAARRCQLRPGGGLRGDRAPGGTGAEFLRKRAACWCPTASWSSPRPTSSTTPNRAASRAPIRSTFTNSISRSSAAR